VLKVMSKMGISTLQSYKGAQQFEAWASTRPWWTSTSPGRPPASRARTWTTLAREVQMRHERAYPPVHVPENLELDVGGLYQWRRAGERHILTPMVIAKLQEATREKKVQTYEQYAEMVNDQTREL
jgi:glutamate synthase (NADPH/NADH) large chain